MTRFFASNCGSSNNRATAAADSPDCHPCKPDAAVSAQQSATSRWGRRPRLRRQCAHEFDTQRTPPRPPSSSSSSVVCAETSTIPNSTNTELRSRDCGSGFTEAPSSRGASETLSAPSPSDGDVLDDDILADVSDDDLSWLDSELPPGGEQQPEEVAGGADDDFLSAQPASTVIDRRSRARLEPPLELRVEDFECGDCIGKGSYSRVFLGTHVVSGTEWALKVVSKRRTFETRENLAHLREEKNIAEKAQGSDFLVRTAGTFQNPKSVVFAMEYLPGGDLYQRLADKSTLPLGEAVAWVAQAVLAIEDLHSLGIVHRDVKPENFLMGKSGTLKLTDFGFARELAPGERLFSQFGTPEYVAPEVLNGCGHGKPVDLWALGVLIYELLVGRTPFKAASVDEMYERIAACDYAFPPPPARRSPSVKGNVSSASTRAGHHHGARSASGYYKKQLSVNRHDHNSSSINHHDNCSTYSKSPSSTKSYKTPSPASTHAPAHFHSMRGGGGGGGGVARGHKKAASSMDSSFSCASSTRFPYSPSAAMKSSASAAAPAAAGQYPYRNYHQFNHPQHEQHHQHQHYQTVEFQEEVDAERMVRETVAAHAQADLLEDQGAQDPAAQALVKSLLQLNPFRRPSIEEIKRHPFFEGVDFEALRAAVRAQADAEEEEAIVNAAIEGGDVWLRDQRVVCLSEDLNDNYGGVFAGF